MNANQILVPVVLAQGTGHPHGDEGGGVPGVVPEPSSLALGVVAVLAYAAYAGYKCARGPRGRKGGGA